MWFNPADLLENKSATLANSANYEPEIHKEALPISKLAELADGNPENKTFSKKTENIQLSTPAIKVYCYRVTDKPDSELTVITHGDDIEEVREGLLNRYGDRLLAVYERNQVVILANETKH